MSGEDVECIATAAERGRTRAALRGAAFVALAPATIWIVPMLFRMGLSHATPRGAAGTPLAAALAVLALVAIAITWYLLPRERPPSTKLATVTVSASQPKETASATEREHRHRYLPSQTLRGR